MTATNLTELTSEEPLIRVEEYEVDRIAIEINDDRGDDNIQAEEMTVDGEKNANEEGKDDEDKYDDGGEAKGHIDKKQKKKSLVVHTAFIEVISKDGKSKYQCIHRKKLLSKFTTSTTSHLINHLKRCMHKKLHINGQNMLQFQPARAKFELKSLSNGRYDHLKQMSNGRYDHLIV